MRCNATGLIIFNGESMANFTKIDNRKEKEGFAVIACEGEITILQGGNGHSSAVIKLSVSEQFLLRSVLTECLRSQQDGVTI